MKTMVGQKARSAGFARDDPAVVEKKPKIIAK